MPVLYIKPLNQSVWIINRLLLVNPFIQVALLDMLWSFAHVSISEGALFIFLSGN